MPLKIRRDQNIFKKIASNVAPVFALSFLISNVAISDSVSSAIKPQEVRLVPENTFIPPGFDDNDNVQLVVSGNLPNTCYKAGVATVQIDQAQKKIFIQNTAYVYSGEWCGQVLVPYLHSVDLGILPVGQYQVLIQDQKDSLHDRGILNVALSKTASPDDSLYAPIEDVFLDDPTSSRSSLVIRGQLSSNCMHLEKIKVLYRESHIIEVLPIASLDEGSECRATSIPFETKVDIQSPWHGSTLIYVRSLNGQAISKIIDF